MDPLTHCLIGGLAAKAVKADNRRFWIMAALGSVPDLDIIANLFGNWAFIFQHRGISHSFVGLVVQALLFSIFLGQWDRRGGFVQRAMHYSLPIGLHIFCDLLTCYGVPLFSPFSLINYSFDLVGSLNFVPAVLTVAGLLWLHRRQKSGWTATSPLWSVWVLYFVLIFTGKTYASKLTESSHGKMVLVPSIMNPFSWEAVASNDLDNAYDHYSVDLLNRRVTLLGKSSRPGTEFPIEASLKDPQIQEFLKESRWPVVRVQKKGDLTRVEWGEIIFSSRGMARGKMAVSVTADGKIVAQDRIHSFWNPETN